MVTRSIKNGCLFLFAAFLFVGPLIHVQVHAAEQGSVRMYKLNKKHQLVRARWAIKQGSETGCHSLRRARSVYRFAQVGFRYCRLFKQSDCQQNSEITAWWDGGRYRSANIDASAPQKFLLPGDKWILSRQEKNINILSWKCEL